MAYSSQCDPDAPAPSAELCVVLLCRVSTKPDPDLDNASTLELCAMVRRELEPSPTTMPTSPTASASPSGYQLHLFQPRQRGPPRRYQHCLLRRIRLDDHYNGQVLIYTDSKASSNAHESRRAGSTRFPRPAPRRRTRRSAPRHASSCNLEGATLSSHPLDRRVVDRRPAQTDWISLVRAEISPPFLPHAPRNAPPSPTSPPATGRSYPPKPPRVSGSDWLLHLLDSPSSTPKTDLCLALPKTQVIKR
ncbi:hypothetical protein ZWY2020_044576 [Hordeum vulgare]|nr:hypothetical protein ZWY2020_044576 [Hordeum vulgare]